MTTLEFIELALLGGLGLRCLQLTLALREIRRDQADAVAASLRGLVVVAGLELPMPSDERWAPQARQCTVDGKPIACLRLGDVVVTELGRLQIDTGSTATALVDAAGIRKYVADVWSAYISRRARLAVEKGNT